jgi:hypothetical protein
MWKITLAAERGMVSETYNIGGRSIRFSVIGTHPSSEAFEPQGQTFGISTRHAR